MQLPLAAALLLPGAWAPVALATGAADQHQVRQQSLEAVRTDLNGLIARYLLLVTSVHDAQGRLISPGTADLATAMDRGPLLISPDDAKELFPAYNRNNRSRAQYADSVHQASGQIIDALWPRALAQPSPQQRNGVLLLGGGVASGKTTALRSNAQVQRLIASTALVRESTLAKLERSAAHISQARAAGRPVEVLYVYAPIEVAVQRLVDRGMQQGRGVAAGAVAASHWRSQQTVLALAERFARDPQVRFHVLISGEAQGPMTLVTVDELRRRRWSADGRFADEQSFREVVSAMVKAELRRRFLDPAPADPTPELRRSLLPQPGS